MQPIDKLKGEFLRVNAEDIEVIYSDDSVDEYELGYEGEQTNNLDIEATLNAIATLQDNAGSLAVWEVVQDDDTKKA